MNEVLLFAVYSVIIFVLVLLCGGSLIGFYFDEKTKYEDQQKKKAADGIAQLASFLERFSEPKKDENKG